MTKKTKAKHLNNGSNSLQNAELSVAQRLRKQHLHNVCNLLQYISLTVIISFLKMKCKCFYDLGKKKKNLSANFKVKSWEQTAKPASCRLKLLVLFKWLLKNFISLSHTLHLHSTQHAKATSARHCLWRSPFPNLEQTDHSSNISM